jgi:ligand-binding sensor protein/putative methionine-R-sulfoxide reductase with GAF domain
MKELNSRNLTHPDLSFKDLIDINDWQKIQDNFSNITEVGVRTVDPKGNPLTSASKWPRLCGELVKKSPLKENLCGECLPTFLGGKGIVDRNLSFICHDGFYNFITPLKNEKGSVLAYVLVGPAFLVMRKPKEEYRQLAEELGVELEDLWSAILEIKLMSFQGMQALVSLINDVGEYIIKLAYRSVSKEKEAVMTLDSPRLNRLLNTLLDVAFQVTGADIGSIMALDSKNEALTIQASRGIPEEIVKSTRVILGDGIAGIAAQERRSFLIDDHSEDNRIKSYLNRPYLRSSMVLPINLEDKVRGVMSLASLKTSAVRFNTHSMRVINSLVHLASLAITPGK